MRPRGIGTGAIRYRRRSAPPASRRDPLRGRSRSSGAVRRVIAKPARLRRVNRPIRWHCNSEEAADETGLCVLANRRRSRGCSRKGCQRRSHPGTLADDIVVEIGVEGGEVRPLFRSDLRVLRKIDLERNPPAVDLAVERSEIAQVGGEISITTVRENTTEATLIITEDRVVVEDEPEVRFVEVIGLDRSLELGKAAWPARHPVTRRQRLAFCRV